jgi:hypothetical protein
MSLPKVERDLNRNTCAMALIGSCAYPYSVAAEDWHRRTFQQLTHGFWHLNSYQPETRQVKGHIWPGGKL